MAQRPTKVGILTPVDPRLFVAAPTAYFLTKEAAKGREWFPKWGYSCAFNRNALVDELQRTRTDLTHYLFLDSDTQPPEDAIERLLAHGVDVVGAAVSHEGTLRPQPGATIGEVKLDPAYAASGTVWMVGESLFGGMIPVDRLPSGLFQCYLIATAALLVKAEVFRRLPWPWFQTVYNDRQMLLSDDFYFCHTLNEISVQAWCDGSVRCSHYRTSDLLGHSLQEVLRGASRRENVVDRFVRDATLADYLDRRQTEREEGPGRGPENSETLT